MWIRKLTTSFTKWVERWLRDRKAARDTDEWLRGFRYADRILINRGKRGLNYLSSCTEAAKVMGTYDTFDAGIEAAIRFHKKLGTVPEPNTNKPSSKEQ